MYNNLKIFLICFLPTLSLAQNPGKDAELSKKGQRLFESSCASCHSFDSHGIGPSLAGITNDLSNMELIEFIKNPQSVIDSGNKRAINLQKKYGSVMPSYASLGEENITNIIAYLHLFKDLPRPLDLTEEGILADPIPEKVEKADFLINLEYQFQVPPSNDELTRTRITKLQSNPSTKELFVLDINGTLYEVKNDKPTSYLDIKASTPNFMQSPGWATGFGSFAFHPDFGHNGLLYTTHTEPADTQEADFKLPEGLSTKLQWVLEEWKTETPLNSPFVGTKRELFRIDMATQAHGMQNIDFNPSAKEGDQEYGMLYIGIGDGGAVERKYPQVANGIHTPWGSLLRIDPSGNNSANGQYGIPTDNPFINVESKKVVKEVYANGFRNPHRFTWTKDGKLICANIGQHNIESVFVVKAGANHGWPKREGNFGINTQESVRKIYRLSGSEKMDGVTYPTLEYDHGEGNAVCGGFVYTGNNIPALKGKYIFGDILKGRLFFADESKMKPGITIDFKEFGIAYKSKETSLLELSNSGHAKLRLGQNYNGDIYVFSMNDGKVYKMVGEN